MYSGSFALKLLSMLQSSREYWDSGGDLSVACIKSIFLKIIDGVVSTASCMSSWRNYFVVSVLGCSFFFERCSWLFLVLCHNCVQRNPFYFVCMTDSLESFYLVWKAICACYILTLDPEIRF